LSSESMLNTPLSRPYPGSCSVVSAAIFKTTFLGTFSVSAPSAPRRKTASESLL
jgi:hypothetical protein